MSAGADRPGAPAGDDIVLRVWPASRELRRTLRPLEWMVLEEVALDARRDDAGDMVAATSARRVAEHLGLTPGAVARALARLRAAGLVTHARQAGPAGRFGLSAYVLGTVPGLEVVESTDGPAGVRPRPVPSRPVLPHVERPRAVDGHMVGTIDPSGSAGADVFPRSLPDDVVAEATGAVDDLVTEERPRSAGASKRDKRGRRSAPKPVVAQLSILDATLDDPTTQP